MLDKGGLTTRTLVSQEMRTMAMQNISSHRVMVIIGEAAMPWKNGGTIC
ncbi:MAG: hypothetical protein PHZ03_03275 [Syntrophomonas sp.]|nr:hypothetical protein [Syntrophomonas sp.]